MAKRKPEAEPDPDEAIVGALILLLSDLSPADAARVLRRARGDLLILDDMKAVSELLGDVTNYLDQALGIADGSSGLGHLAVSNLRGKVNVAKRSSERVLSIIGPPER